LEDQKGNPQVFAVGGIDGLATAQGLLRRSIEPDVVERAAAWSYQSAEMYLPGQLGPGVGRAQITGLIARPRLRDYPPAITPLPWLPHSFTTRAWRKCQRTR
jgi:hypothetical protein